MAFSFNFPAPILYSDGLEKDSWEKNSSEPDETESADVVLLSQGDIPLPESFLNCAARQSSFRSYKEHFIVDSCLKKPDELVTNLPVDCDWSFIEIGNKTLHFLNPEWIEHSVDELKLLTNNSHSDIVPGIYEGGFRVWDGARDLLSFLSADQQVELAGKDVLELGCGAGLPGIFAALSGAAKISFHDYNCEVVDSCTIPNILRNVSPLLVRSNIRLFSGDWEEYLKNSKEEFDVILTSDTVYRKDVLSKLLRILPKLLKKHGVVYLAGKSHYFGLDGGTDCLREEVANGKQLRVIVAKEFPDSVRREVLTLSRI